MWPYAKHSAENIKFDLHMRNLFYSWAGHGVIFFSFKFPNCYFCFYLFKKRAFSRKIVTFPTKFGYVDCFFSGMLAFFFFIFLT